MFEHIYNLRWFLSFDNFFSPKKGKQLHEDEIECKRFENTFKLLIENGFVFYIDEPVWFLLERLNAIENFMDLNPPAKETSFYPVGILRRKIKDYFNSDRFQKTYNDYRSDSFDYNENMETIRNTMRRAYQSARIPSPEPRPLLDADNLVYWRDKMPVLQNLPVSTTYSELFKSMSERQAACMYRDNAFSDEWENIAYMKHVLWRLLREGYRELKGTVPSLPLSLATHRQGDKGFVAFVRKQYESYMSTPDDERGVIAYNCKGDQLQPFQHKFSWCMQKKLLQRVLVCWPTGAGKTVGMVIAISSYFYDTRPKIVIVPTMFHILHFVENLFKFKNRYRSFLIDSFANNRNNVKIAMRDFPQVWTFAQSISATIKVNDGIDIVTCMKKLDEGQSDQAKTQTKIAFLSCMLSVIEMKSNLRAAGRPNELAAPMRVFEYVSASGERVFGSQTQDPIFRHVTKGKNVFDNKIVVMDEMHYLKGGTPIKMEAYRKNLDRLAEALRTAKDCAIVGFTATMSDPLLRIVMGVSESTNIRQTEYGSTNPKPLLAEGFVHYMNEFPSEVYPSIILGPNPLYHANFAIQPNFGIIKVVDIPKTSTLYLTYKRKYRELCNSCHKKTALDQRIMYKLMNAINMSTSYTHTAQGWLDKYKSNPLDVGPKIKVLVSDLMSHKLKTLVLVDRRQGYSGVKAALLASGLTFADFCSAYDKTDPESTTCVRLFNANDNTTGGKIRIALADAMHFGTGVDFKQVRYIYLLNPPVSYVEWKQNIGRVLRMCAYDSLPAASREVKVVMYVGDFQSNTTQPTKSVQKVFQAYKNPFLDSRVSSQQTNSVLKKQEDVVLNVDEYALRNLLNGKKEFEWYEAFYVNNSI